MNEKLQSKDPKDKCIDSRWSQLHLRTKTGLIFSGVYLLIIIITVGFKHKAFIELDLNNLGDFLAGVFAPLALLWLVIGYFQQGDELRQNSQALLLQAEELRQAAEHAGGILEVARQEHELAIARLNEEKELRASAEMEANATAQKLNKRKIQPRFSFENSEKFMNYAHLKLKNYGQGCKKFSVEIPHNSLIYLNRPVLRDEIGPLMPTEFDIKLVNPGKIGDTRIILRWVDSEGDEQEEKFIVALLKHSIEIKSERL